MIYCSLALIVSIVGFWMIPGNYFIFDCIAMSFLGFFIFGPQLLVGLAAVEFVDKRAACTANGFAGFFAYIGAAATGYPLGKIIDLWAWEGFFCCSFSFCSSYFSNTFASHTLQNRFFTFTVTEKQNFTLDNR